MLGAGVCPMEPSAESTRTGWFLHSGHLGVTRKWTFPPGIYECLVALIIMFQLAFQLLLVQRAFPSYFLATASPTWNQRAADPFISNGPFPVTSVLGHRSLPASTPCPIHGLFGTCLQLPATKTLPLQDSDEPRRTPPQPQQRTRCLPTAPTGFCELAAADRAGAAISRSCGPAASHASPANARASPASADPTSPLAHPPDSTCHLLPPQQQHRDSLWRRPPQTHYSDCCRETRRWQRRLPSDKSGGCRAGKRHRGAGRRRPSHAGRTIPGLGCMALPPPTRAPTPPNSIGPLAPAVFKHSGLSF
ncbi:uncharacterized protein LOC143844169 [Paroedura picta]|uniref:uncharacterized protein LOC143844169 n=1 Tax=Paroedura picta TaxID=143630 RepID=UPI0040574B56